MSEQVKEEDTPSLELETQMHTVFMTVGPSNCGKSHFSTRVLIPALQKKLRDQGIEPNIGYISSDDLRRQLIGNDNLDKYKWHMMEVSKQAFNLVDVLLTNYISFPVNKHFVVVDTTGLSKEFRDKIQKIAEDHQYHSAILLFKYSDRNVYYRNGGDREVISRHLEKFNKEVLRELGGGPKHVVKSQVERCEVDISDLTLYRQCELPSNRRYFVVGDLHECIDEFKQLIIEHGFTVDETGMIQRTEKTNNTDIIMIGDLVDKGSKTRETVEFFHNNRENPVLHFVLGNHESSIKKLLIGEVKLSSYKAGFAEKFYSSYFVLRDDPVLATKFLELYKLCRPYFHYTSADNVSRSFYVTHAPCWSRYIGKLDTKSQKRQSYIFKTDKAVREFMNQYLNTDAYTFPLHLVGHLAISHPYMGLRDGNNIVMIDTGCIHGNKLTGILLGSHIKMHRFSSVSFLNSQPKMEQPLESMRTKEESTDLTEKLEGMEPEQQRRVHVLARDKINFISGTICPADKDPDANCLESLRKGLEYYRGKVRFLSVQPKYMGSRCNMYLYPAVLEESFMVSRNGYKIKGVPAEKALEMYRKMFAKLEPFIQEHKIRMIIIDGELMPWRAIGAGLIDSSFVPIDIGMSTEVAELQDDGFEEQYKELVAKMLASGFDEDANKMSGQDLNKKYGGSTYQSYKAVREERRSHLTVDQWLEYSRTYHDQIVEYGKDEEVYYKPFGILKIVKEDGTEIIPAVNGLPNLNEDFGSIQIFKTVSDDEQLVVDLEDFEKAISDTQAFFDKLTVNQKMEGIVLKPDIVRLDCAPFIKVRNEHYLTIIYGPDYKSPSKYAKLLKQKGVRRKLETSIKEFSLGVEMLKIPIDQISIDNHKFVSLVIDFLFQEEAEKTIDPRL